MLVYFSPVENISTSLIQRKVRKLERMGLLMRNTADKLQINNTHFHTWLLENVMNEV